MDSKPILHLKECLCVLLPLNTIIINTSLQLFRGGNGCHDYIHLEQEWTECHMWEITACEVEFHQFTQGNTAKEQLCGELARTSW